MNYLILSKLSSVFWSRLVLGASALLGSHAIISRDLLGTGSLFNAFARF